MKKNSLKAFKLSAYMPYKDNEGNVVEKYSDTIIVDKALIWPASSKLQSEVYGLRINDILNMHYYGSHEINMHDLIEYNDVKYKVISIKKNMRFRALEIERK